MCLWCLRALCAYAPYVPACLRGWNYYVLTCPKLLRAYVPTCLRAYVSTRLKLLRAYVPTSLKLLRAYVPTYPHFSRVYVLKCVYIFFMPTCLCALNYFVPMCAHFSRAYVPTTTHKIYWGSLLYLVLLFFFWIIWPFIPFKTPKQTPAFKTAYLSPNLRGFVTSTAASAETTIWGTIKKLSKTKDSF